MPTNQRHKSPGRKGSARSGQSRRAGGQSSYGMEELGGQASRYLERGRSQIHELTRDHEGTAVLIALAAGFGVGLVLGSVIASSTRRPQTWSERLAAQDIGQRLLARIESLIPDALAERLGK